MRGFQDSSGALCLLVVLAREVFTQISPTRIDSAFSAGQESVEEYRAKNDAAFRSGYYLKGPSAPAQHQHTTAGRAPSSFGDHARLFCAATLDLVNKKSVSRDATSGLRNLTLESNTRAKAAQDACINAVRENSSCRNVNRYTFDGSCNNLGNPILGRTNTCHKRLLPPSYEDGVEEPRRRSFSGGVLPNERVISLRALDYILPRVRDDPQYNHNRMSFGQFIAHDITLTHTTTIGTSNALPDCCSPSTRVEQCFPVTIPSPDRVYGNRGCMNFVRSEPCPTCQLGPREQMNSVTSFVDLSLIYGLTSQGNFNLRTGSGGLLRGQAPYDTARPYLPLFMPPTTQTLGDGCSQPGRPCFTGGDPLRVNQQIGISAWSTLWFRYHNYLADRINRHARSRGERWSDERIFQTARRIAQGHMQIQVYREWLPTVVGSNILSVYKLGIQRTQTDYDSDGDPSLWSEFAGGAFRFGHSLIQNVFKNRNYQTDVDQPEFDVPTRDAFSTIPNYYDFNSEFKFENFIAGMQRQGGDETVTSFFDASQPKQISFSFAPGVANDVYRNATESYGMDLAALNIHRGRDHGLQPYYKYAELYLSRAHGRNIRIQKFSDIRPFWRSECYDELPKVYRDIQDVDLYVGGLCEVSPISGSVGPTMGTIIAMQFQQLRYADRLFVSHRNVFTPTQYAELLRTGWLYWVVCASAVNQPAVYRNAFRHDLWDFEYCSDLREIDVSLFTDVASYV
ncbi:peroxidasin homolog [Galendromus occidentalis]|uniref:Peroxidasin homolog n=1 Tax=Galendromus occidentalis TaxID=34638 RepID=A0AAJ7WGK6_9ACAR|nr:peroxidasin homolog [Galendromus occidentalis]